MADKLSRAQVARMLGVTTKTLGAWERSGRIPTPKRDWRGWRVYDDKAIHAINAAMSAEGVPPIGMLPAPGDAPHETQISARNALPGVVSEIIGDGVLCEVTLDLGGGLEVVAVITRSSVERLGLAPGVVATAVIKSTEVMIAR